MMYLRLAWRNIWRNKRRTIITLSSIGFAVFFACIMQSMQKGSYERMIENTVRFSTGHIQVHEAGYWDEKILDNSFLWDDRMRELLTGSSDILAVSPRIESFALGAATEQTKGVLVLGIVPELEEEITQLSRKLDQGHFLNKPKDVLLGKDLANFLKVKAGDSLILIGQGYHGVNAAGTFHISGTLKFPNPLFNQQAVVLDLEDAQYFYGAEGLVTSVSILLEESDVIESIQSELTGGLGESYEVMSWDEMIPELVQSIELDYYGGLIMIYILYAVIAFGIFGTYLMMVKERIYEFGILVSIGMRKLRLQRMVLLEILMLSVLGVIGGVLLSSPILIYMYLNPIILQGEMAATYESFGMEPILPFSLDPSIFLSQGIVVLIISAFLSIYPMLAVQSLKITQALKE